MHGAAAVHSALTQYLTRWFHFPVLQTWNFELPAAILIVDEIHLPTLLAYRPGFLDKPSRQSMVVLCANPARQAILSRDIRNEQVEIICKPFGPFKLAKVLRRALEKIAKLPNVAVPASGVSKHSTDVPAQVPDAPNRSYSTSSHAPHNTGTTTERDRRHNPVGGLPKDISIRGKVPSSGPEGGYPFPVITASMAARLSRPTSPAKPHSTTGQTDGKAASLSPSDAPRQDGKHRELFGDMLSPMSLSKCPLQMDQAEGMSGERIAMKFDGDTTRRPHQNSYATPKTSTLLNARQLVATLPPTVDQPRPGAPPPAEVMARAKESKATEPSTASPPTSTSAACSDIRNAPKSPRTRKPKLLLVDDNRLNLNLLDTYVKKRGYGGDLCHLAEDVWQAVNAFEQFTPDVVFMDISMPQMDGIEATRRIRMLEASRRESDVKEQTPFDESGPRSSKSALVVALTGNAKSSDQAEALRSGVDLYMTKPVSLKRVGTLLDNWREDGD